MTNLVLTKRFPTLVAALFAVALLGACSKSEEPAATAEPAVADTADTPVEDTTADDNETTEDETAADDSLVVVEESAAEPEDTGEEAIVLAQADTAAATIDFKYSEGEHYTRLVPTQPTVGGADKVEVAEVFWYGCAHCYTLEPFLSRWEDTKPASVRLERVPAMWNDVLVKHAQLFYTEQMLVRSGLIADPAAFSESVFVAIHRQGNRLLTDDAIAAHFERFGVSRSDFDQAWNSFEVAQQLRKAADLTRRYGTASVPAIVVNGKYRSGAQQAGGYDKLIEVIDELVVREGAR